MIYESIKMICFPFYYCQGMFATTGNKFSKPMSLSFSGSETVRRRKVYRYLHWLTSRHFPTISKTSMVTSTKLKHATITG
ncbi:hypothetical protein PHAVU_004G064000 [Phaseolus vulgaris]|uniref:Uncharacterized protein n=1 Tax=Phaseolus vulgaris TaxID=3885 RepID=V7C2Y9_PHAVU|nr:hypothetical protein PHAVU_004G064000g [Phaseolus vulgaris]ESW23635.1 hypothetical protein PHAVU_004G064000g [Phaseolus vulgaris]